MTAFLRAIDNKTWKAIIKRWSPPVKTATEESSSTAKPTFKEEADWTSEEDAEALENSKALNAIFNGVDKNLFKLISTCTVAKEAWEILMTAHEGTSRVTMSRLQMLTTQFETLKMYEEQTIAEFHMQIRDIANTSFALGEQMTNEKLVRKILRSLPKRFAVKGTAIEEAQDISQLQVDELIGSLQAFEMTLNDKSEKKTKSIAFLTNAEMEDEEPEADLVGEFSDALALLGRKFNKAFKKFDRKSKPNVSDKLPDIYRKTDNARSLGFQRKGKDEERPSRSRGIQCHECEGVGHIKAECPTFLKKQKKGMAVTWYDDESEEENDDVTANIVKSLTVRVTEDVGSSDEEMTDEELADTYKLMFTNWKEMCVTCEKQKKIILDLSNENSRLKDAATCLDHDKEIQALQIQKKKLEAVNGDLLEEISLLECKLEIG